MSRPKKHVASSDKAARNTKNCFVTVITPTEQCEHTPETSRSLLLPSTPYEGSLPLVLSHSILSIKCVLRSFYPPLSVRHSLISTLLYRGPVCPYSRPVSVPASILPSSAPTHRRFLLYRPRILSGSTEAVSLWSFRPRSCGREHISPCLYNDLGCSIVTLSAEFCAMEESRSAALFGWHAIGRGAKWQIRFTSKRQPCLLPNSTISEH